MKSNAEVLRAAASAMRKRGHAKGVLVSTDGRMCIAGAINFVLTGDPMKWPTRTNKLLLLVSSHILRKKLSEFGSPIGWNNREDTKAEQVIGALRGTARECVARSRS